MERVTSLWLLQTIQNVWPYQTHFSFLLLFVYGNQGVLDLEMEVENPVYLIACMVKLTSSPHFKTSPFLSFSLWYNARNSRIPTLWTNAACFFVSVQDNGVPLDNRPIPCLMHSKESGNTVHPFLELLHYA